MLRGVWTPPWSTSIFCSQSVALAGQPLMNPYREPGGHFHIDSYVGGR